LMDITFFRDFVLSLARWPSGTIVNESRREPP
jgi:hypothetical protein